MITIPDANYPIRALLPATIGSVTQKVVAIVRCHPWTAIGLTVGALSLASAGLAVYYGISQLNKPKDIFDAARKGDVKAIESFLASGVDVNVKTSYNLNLLLHIVAWWGHDKVAEILLKNGAEVDATENDGWTSLHIVAWGGYDKVAEILLKNGAKVNATENDGWTPLHLAAQAGRDNVVEILLANRADVNAITEDGYTPLHMAAFNGHAIVVQLLLNQQADPSMAEDDGNTALDLARKQNELAADDKKSQFDKVIKLLESAPSAAYK